MLSRDEQLRRYGLRDGQLIGDTRLYGEGNICVGGGSHINHGTIIQAWGGCTVFIGCRVRIGPYVCIYTKAHRADQDFNTKKPGDWQGDVTIEDFAFIGAHCTILPGVTIGENAVVAANSLVTRDVPGYAIVAGVPAQIWRYKSIDPQGRSAR